LISKALTPLVFIFALGGQQVMAQGGDLLFQKVFGKKEKAQTLKLPLFSKNFFVAELSIKVKSDKLISVSNRDFFNAIKEVFSPEIVNKLKVAIQEKKITNELLKEYKINIQFNQDDLKLNITYPVAYQKLSINNAGIQIPEWARDFLRPSENSFILNYDLQENITSNSAESSYFRADLNPIYQYKGFVFENEFYYQTLNGDKKLKREYSRIIKNDESKQISYSIGDIQYPVVGYQDFRSLLGFAVTRDFSLNPYKTVTPLNSQEFILEKRSLVKIYVNSRLIKVDYLNEGRHSIRDLPLNSGLNDIIIDTDDGTSQKRFHFQRSTSADLLAVGLSRFSFSSGIEADDSIEEKTYNKSNGPTLNASYSLGVLENLTLGTYAQGDKESQLTAINGIYTTTSGNLYFNTAISYADSTALAYSLNYSISDFGNIGFSDYRVATGVEWLGEKFQTIADSEADNESSYKFNVSLTKSITTGQSLSLSSFYEISRSDKLNDPYGLNLSFDTRISSDISVSLFLGRDKQNTGQWNDTLYFFFNYNIPTQNTYFNAFYDSKNRIKRANIRYQSPKNINATNLRATLGQTSTADVYEGEVEHKTSFAHFNIRHNNEQNKTTGHNSNTNLKVRGSLLMADNHFALSSPVGDSFALIRPNKYLKGQKLALKSHSQYEEGDNSLSDTIVIPDLTAYHYRRFQFDTRDLEPGRSLEKENFVLYPGYRTGHFLSVGQPGVITYIGKLVFENGPYSLKLCQLKSLDNNFQTDFFTNKKGRFVIEGLRPGKYQITLEDGKEVIFELSDQKVGIVKGSPLEIGN